MIDSWRKQLGELSGNLTTNEPMPAHLVEKLLEEDIGLGEKLELKKIDFPAFGNTILDSVQGLNILKGLQSLRKPGCLTVFRAMRFPTSKRMYGMVADTGFAFSNYEQDRILSLYSDKEYLERRKSIKAEPRFWIQPQERVVNGVPVFCLVNDALQIHRAYRGETDKVAIVAIHIPLEHLKTRKITLVANTAIDLGFEDSTRDVSIHGYVDKGTHIEPDFAELRARGVDLHEMYSADLPKTYEDALKLGIEQEFYLLDIHKVRDGDPAIAALYENSDVLKSNKGFLHGFFGDQNIFGRRNTTYLPTSCYRISLK